MKRLTYLIPLFSLLSGAMQAQSWEVLDERSINDIFEQNGILYKVGDEYDTSWMQQIHFLEISTDQGHSWEQIQLNPFLSIDPASFPSTMTVGFFDNQNGIVGLKGNLTNEFLRTSDGGQSWESFLPWENTNCLTGQPWNIGIVNDSVAVISRFNYGDYYITFDRGLTWNCNESFSVANTPRFFSFGIDLFYNYDAINGIYRSTDTGNSWSKMLEGEFNSFLMVNQTEGYAIPFDFDGFELVKTVDGWNTYQTIFEVPNPDGWFFETFLITPDDQGFFFYGEEIFFSENIAINEAPVSLQNIGFEPFRIEFALDKHYAVGRGLAVFDPDGVINGIQMRSVSSGKIFPNPANRDLFFSTPDHTKFRLYNSLGGLVKSGEINTTALDLSKVPSGLYYLELIGPVGEKKEVHRLMIQK